MRQLIESSKIVAKNYEKSISCNLALKARMSNDNVTSNHESENLRESLDVIAVKDDVAYPLDWYDAHSSEERLIYQFLQKFLGIST